jgi:hypothetical protein
MIFFETLFIVGTIVMKSSKPPEFVKDRKDCFKAYGEEEPSSWAAIAAALSVSSSSSAKHQRSSSKSEL